jgi:hypothetical protein
MSSTGSTTPPTPEVLPPNGISLNNYVEFVLVNNIMNKNQYEMITFPSEPTRLKEVSIAMFNVGIVGYTPYVMISISGSTIKYKQITFDTVIEEMKTYFIIKDGLPITGGRLYDLYMVNTGGVRFPRQMPSRGMEFR